MAYQTYDENDIHSAALCSWKEARGEGEKGMFAVLCVLNNRIGKPGFAHTLHDIIYGKNQFTSMSVPSDPEFNLQPTDGDRLYASALQDAEKIFGGPVSSAANFTELGGDITNGSCYYANLHEIPTEGWFYQHIVLDSYNHPVRAQIGKHTFFA